MLDLFGCDQNQLVTFVGAGLVPARKRATTSVAPTPQPELVTPDLFDAPVEQYTETQETAISDLVQRLRKVATEQTSIILMKVTVYDTLAKKLKQAGFNVIEERIRFPAQAWQQDFQSHFVKALKKAALR